MALVMPTYPVSQQTQGGYYASNLVVMAEYLMNHGYSAAAAAGIAGAVAGESSGSPESVGSGGAGLIAWTPPSKAAPYQPIVTGNWQRDFDVQLADILEYNRQQGNAALQSLNRQTDPVAAARYYSIRFERPAVPYSDVRPNVAQYVYNAVQGRPTKGLLTPGDKNVSSGGGTIQATTTSFNPLNPLTWFNLFGGGSTFTDYLQRFGLIVFGGILILIGIFMLAGKQTIKLVAPETAAAGKVMGNASDSEGT